MRIGIVGIGNPLRQDDGIGIVLLDKLMDVKNDLPHDLEYVDGGIGGMNLLHVLARFDVMILIDAVNFNGRPGELKVFTPDELRSLKPLQTLSTHVLDFFEVLRLSTQLHEEPEELYICGIQPKQVSEGMQLSPELEHLVPLLIDALKQEIMRIYQRKR